jgi:sporulation protein YlmC with PRC-barrel domain
MAHFGTLKSFRFSEGDADDIRGAIVYGRDDEKLGKIDDVIFDHSTGAIHYAVVDTGGWLSSRKFVVPSGQLTPSATHEDDYQIALTKDQIEKFPAYDEEDVDSAQDWKSYQERYKNAWHAGPVQHRRGSDRDVTPDADEVPSEPDTGSAYTGTKQPILDVTPDRLVPPAGNEVEIAVSGAGIGPRWLAFEDRLRQRRREIILGCTTCNRSMESETASDRERDAQRKAS